ncbi:MAG: DUF5667 domain-containing protein, partial [Anaerolineae bacterium]
MKDSLPPEVLDQAVQRLKEGATPSEILADYPSAAASLKPLLAMVQQLEALRTTEMPLREHQISDRAAFLAKARNLRAQGVSPHPLMRLKRWITAPFSNSSFDRRSIRKEKRAMAVMLLKAVLALMLGLGSASGTLALAEQSLPGSPLYPVKLAAEEVAVRTNPDPADRALVYLAQAKARVREMEALVQLHRSPDEAMLERLRTRLENALRLASGLADPEMKDWLIQARAMVQTQQETLTRTCQHLAAAGVSSNAPCDALALMHQAREQIESGLQNPDTFRHRHALRPENRGDHEQVPNATPSAQPGPGEPGGNPERECPECTPEGDQ